MTVYIGLADTSSEDAFGVWFPDLPGCTAMADTKDELLSVAADVVRMWMEAMIDRGESVPKPRDVAALLDDPEVQEALREDQSSFVEVPMLLDSKGA